jgi:hypothetical protein
METDVSVMHTASIIIITTTTTTTLMTGSTHL